MRPAPTTRRRLAAAITAAVTGLGGVVGVGITMACAPPARAEQNPAPANVRFATLDLSLHLAAPGQLNQELETGTDPRVAQLAAVIQRNQPDVILLSGLDPADPALTVDRVRRELEVQRPSSAALNLPHVFTLADSGSEPMAVLSRFPIDHSGVRTFDQLRWADLPGAMLPDDPAVAGQPLSSNGHWDVPILIGNQVVHSLVSHPISPSAGDVISQRRNHDEIAFWADYITPGRLAGVRDDQGRVGGLAPEAAFVVMGDQGADPSDGPRLDGSIQQLLENKRLVDPLPASDGASAASAAQAAVNLAQRGDPAYDTADLPEAGGPGNLRTDYLLPSRAGLLYTASGVDWPLPEDPRSGELASEHRLVWLDLRLG